MFLSGDVLPGGQVFEEIRFWLLLTTNSRIGMGTRSCVAIPHYSST